jgi:hypothetical protein
VCIGRESVPTVTVVTDNRCKADSDSQQGETSGAVPAGEAEDSGSQEAISRKVANQNCGEEQTAISENNPVAEASLAKDSGEQLQVAISRKAANQNGREEHIAVSESTIDTSGEHANPEMQIFGTSGKGYEDADDGKTASGEVGDKSTGELVSPLILTRDGI